MLVFLALFSTAIGLIATLFLFRTRKRVLKRRFYQKICILKPIRGLEPHLRENLESFFNLSPTIPFEILFSVKNPRDPAISTIEDLIAKYPEIEARIFIGTPDMGRNPKVNNIHYAWNRASTDLILISDSNVKVPPDYLERLHAERQGGAGLVTQAVYAADATGIGGHLDAVSINTNYLKGTWFLTLFGHHNVLGKCMYFSRNQFDNLGGLRRVRNYLAEDLVMGEIMKDGGYMVRLAPELLHQTSIMTTFKEFWHRHVRWARLRKCHVPHFYFLEPLFFETIWPVIMMIADPSAPIIALGLTCLTLQWGCNFLIHRHKIKNPTSNISFRWFLVKDILIPMIWIAGVISNKVNWRGQPLHLQFGGRLRASKEISLPA